ncbi:hypothetical protein LAL4801_04209 [Roseibium aggregatum]|uniref:Uncharacterized protein n=2 Tax=Roseibium aggregatum TaxID=187304 RepID=A0A0M6Y7R4_9HYPH|nr:hypothetical protein LAL4801_04209 [Roseibium aggregatum]
MGMISFRHLRNAVKKAAKEPEAEVAEDAEKSVEPETAPATAEPQSEPAQAVLLPDPAATEPAKVETLEEQLAAMKKAQVLKFAKEASIEVDETLGVVELRAFVLKAKEGVDAA